MKKFLKFLGIVVLLAVIFVLVSGLFISRQYHFERSITINSSKEEIWKNISLFANLDKWDPWKVKDPKMTRTITGTDGTVGATYTWKGNEDVGSGSQTFTALQPYEHVTLLLQFKEPFETKANVFYHLVTEGNAVKVTWGFDSKMPYPFNAIGYFFLNMDERMDKDFTPGLANLKKLCESNTTMTAINYNK